MKKTKVKITMINGDVCIHPTSDYCSIKQFYQMVKKEQFLLLDNVVLNTGMIVSVEEVAVDGPDEFDE